jgi:hypothetical protein
MFLYRSPDWTRVVEALQKRLAALEHWLGGRDDLEDPASQRARVEEAHPISRAAAVSWRGRRWACSGAV